MNTNLPSMDRRGVLRNNIKLSTDTQCPITGPRTRGNLWLDTILENAAQKLKRLSLVIILSGGNTVP